MTRLANAGLLMAAVFLASCSAGEKPRMADIVAPAQAYEDFGSLRVHYNAIPTLSMSEAVAREYGVERDARAGLVTIAVRNVVDGEEIAAESEVQAVAVDLQGMRQSIALHAARTGDYTDHIGTFRIAERDSYRFEITVKSAGRSESVKFQRNF